MCSVTNKVSHPYIFRHNFVPLRSASPLPPTPKATTSILFTQSAHAVRLFRPWSSPFHLLFKVRQVHEKHRNIPQMAQSVRQEGSDLRPLDLKCLGLD